MAGSLSHIIDTDGTFTMDLIDNLGDAHEALEECFAVIIELSGGNMGKVSKACVASGHCDPYKKYVGDEVIPKPMTKEDYVTE